ncbi:MAG: hypothetical protein ACYCZX_12520 [Rhodospirillaceae bacterium]
MPLPTRKTNRHPTARVPAALVHCRHIAWDGHDLVVISRFDVIRD